MRNIDFVTGIQYGFQDASSIICIGIQDLHHDIIYWLIIILTIVVYIVIVVVNESNYNIEKIENKENKKSMIILKDFQENYINRNKISHGAILEILWTITPTVILILIAMPSFALLYSMDEIEDPEETIKVIGNQWYWSFDIIEKNWIVEVNLFKSDIKNFLQGIVTITYDSAKYISFDSYMLTINELSKGDIRLLEVDNPLYLDGSKFLRFILTSSDVLHSFSVPSLGIKIDTVPGRLNEITTLINRQGVFFGQCSELCGVNHGFMPIEIVSENKIFNFMDLSFN